MQVLPKRARGASGQLKLQGELLRLAFAGTGGLTAPQLNHMFFSTPREWREPKGHSFRCGLSSTKQRRRTSSLASRTPPDVAQDVVFTASSCLPGVLHKVLLLPAPLQQSCYSTSRFSSQMKAPRDISWSKTLGDAAITCMTLGKDNFSQKGN